MVRLTHFVPEFLGERVVMLQCLKIVADQLDFVPNAGDDNAIILFGHVLAVGEEYFPFAVGQ